MTRLKQYFGHSMRRLNCLEKSIMLVRVEDKTKKRTAVSWMGSIRAARKGIFFFQDRSSWRKSIYVVAMS